MKFVEAERVGSIHAVEDMLLTARACFRRALKHEGLPEDTVLVVFSDDNPYVIYYEKAMAQYFEMAGNVAAHGYEGLSVRTRTVYKRKRAPKKKKAA